MDGVVRLTALLALAAVAIIGWAFFGPAAERPQSYYAAPYSLPVQNAEPRWLRELVWTGDPPPTSPAADAPPESAVDPAVEAAERAALRERIISEGDDACQPRLLIFTADWCGPCQAALHPALDELRSGRHGAWRVGFGSHQHLQVIDCPDANPDNSGPQFIPPGAWAFEVTALPTFIRIEDGREVSRVEGLFNQRTWKPGELARRLTQYRNGTWSPAPEPVAPAAAPASPALTAPQ